MLGSFVNFHKKACEDLNRNDNVFYSLLSEVSSHEFCHVCSVTETSPGPVWEATTRGPESQEVRILGPSCSLTFDFCSECSLETGKLGPPRSTTTDPPGHPSASSSSSFWCYGQRSGGSGGRVGVHPQAHRK